MDYKWSKKKKIDGEGKIVELNEAKVGKRKYNTGLCLGCVFLINNDRRLSYKEKLIRRVTSIIYIKVEVIGDTSTHLHFYHPFFWHKRTNGISFDAHFYSKNSFLLII